jgi:hypothetical protein
MQYDLHARSGTGPWGQVFIDICIATKSINGDGRGKIDELYYAGEGTSTSGEPF